MIQYIIVTVQVNKMSPYSNNNYLSSTVSMYSNYCLTTVQQLLSKLLLQLNSRMEMTLLSNYSTVW